MGDLTETESEHSKYTSKIKTFKVTIEKGKDGYRDISVDFQNSEGQEKSGEPDFSDSFRELADKWTSVSISFFELVPTLSSLGHYFADHGFENHTLKRIKEISVETISESSGDTKRDTYFVPEDRAGSFIKTLSKTTQISIAASVLSRNALTSLISEYESFISSFLLLLSSINDAPFIAPDATISLAEASEYDDFQSLKRAMVSREIEDFIHDKSHLEILKFLEEKFGVNLTSDANLIKEFVEICQRRHIIIHSGGKVSRRYIRNCVKAGWKESDLPALGEEIRVSRKYLRRATARVFQIGFFTLHIIWQKLKIEQRESSISQVLWASHEFLENDLTKMSSRVCSFALNGKTKYSSQTRAYLIINKAQAAWFDKKKDKDQKIKERDKILSEHDWSIKDPIISLALGCLNESWEEMDRLVERARDHGLSYEAVFTWNIFREAWQHQQFVEAVCKNFDLRIENLSYPPSRRSIGDLLTMEGE